MGAYSEFTASSPHAANVWALSQMLRCRTVGIEKIVLLCRIPFGKFKGKRVLYRAWSY